MRWVDCLRLSLPLSVDRDLVTASFFHDGLFGKEEGLRDSISGCIWIVSQAQVGDTLQGCPRIPYWCDAHPRVHHTKLFPKKE